MIELESEQPVERANHPAINCLNSVLADETTDASFQMLNQSGHHRKL